MINFDKYISSKSAVLICSAINRRYLCGFKSSAGYLLLTDTGNYCFVDGRYYEAAKTRVKNNFKVVLLERVSKQIGDIVRRLNLYVLYTETDITVGFLNDLNNILPCKVIAESSLSQLILYERSIKEQWEIDNIIAAQRIAERAYNNVLNFIKAGITEREIALELDYQMQKLGSEGTAFETVAVSGGNSALPHGVPTDKKLENGDFFTLDFGAVQGGYRSDMTRTVAIGYATDEMEAVYNLVLEAQNAALMKAKAGVKCKAVDAAARDIITHAGYAGNFGHGTGHGVGLEIHEYPNVSGRNDKELIVNQLITVEPGVYLPEKFGVRIEDMAVIKVNTSENLTNCEKTLIIL